MEHRAKDFQPGRHLRHFAKPGDTHGEAYFPHWKQMDSFSPPQVGQRSFPPNFKYSFSTTYEWLERLKKYKARALGLAVTIGGEAGVREWIQLTMFEDKQVEAQLIEQCLKALRELQGDGQVKAEAPALHFESGQDLLDWVEDVRTTIEPNEIKQ